MRKVLVLLVLVVLVAASGCKFSPAQRNALEVQLKYQKEIDKELPALVVHHPNPERAKELLGISQRMVRNLEELLSDD
ncbi:MAG: hypothetical protein ACXADB_05295 [Candidatus Hermodarchaeia archaeon]